MTHAIAEIRRPQRIAPFMNRLSTNASTLQALEKTCKKGETQISCRQICDVFAMVPVESGDESVTATATWGSEIDEREEFRAQVKSPMSSTRLLQPQRPGEAVPRIVPCVESYRRGAHGDATLVRRISVTAPNLLAFLRRASQVRREVRGNFQESPETPSVKCSGRRLFWVVPGKFSS